MICVMSEGKNQENSNLIKLLKNLSGKGKIRGNIQGSNIKENPQVKPSNAYSSASYRNAVKRACQRAFKTLNEEGKEFNKEHYFCPMGKTNAVIFLLLSLLNGKLPFLLFDWKRNYRDILGMCKEPLHIYTVGRDVSPFYFNPLVVPQGVEPSTWVKLLVELISLAYFGGEGSSHLIVKAIDSCYKEFGIYKGSKSYPSFIDVHNKIKLMKVKGRSAEWMQTVQRTLESMCYGSLGKVINNPTHINTEELLKQFAILELDNLTQNADKIFLISTLSLHIQYFRLQEQKREVVKGIMVFDECHHLFLKGFKGTPLMENFLREVREYGVGCILIDQEPSSLSRTVIANTNTQFTFKLNEQRDVNTAGSYSLISDKAKAVFGLIPIGMAVVRIHRHSKINFKFVRKGLKIS